MSDIKTGNLYLICNPILYSYRHTIVCNTLVYIIVEYANYLLIYFYVYKLYIYAELLLLLSTPSSHLPPSLPPLSLSLPLSLPPSLPPLSLPPSLPLFPPLSPSSPLSPPLSPSLSQSDISDTNETSTPVSTHDVGVISVHPAVPALWDFQGNTCDIY